MSEQLYEQALAAITALFSDTSVSQSETKKQLESLSEEIDILIDTLR